MNAMIEGALQTPGAVDVTVELGGGRRITGVVPDVRGNRISMTQALAVSCNVTFLTLANELGVDGTVRYLRNVMGLWLLQESQRTWAAAGQTADLPDLLAAAARVPAFTTPGQRTIIGMRMPPSQVLPLPSRKRPALPPWSPMISHGPLSLLKKTRVFSATPSARSALSNSPTLQSISSTASP